MAKSPTRTKSTVSSHEGVVIRAAGTGEIADFINLKAPPLLRAEILHKLMTGMAQDKRKHADPVTPRGVRIKGAVIVGELDLSGWSGRADDPSRPLPTLELEACTLEEPLYLDDSHIHSISMRGCTLPLLSADSARIDGSVRLNGSVIAGNINKHCQEHRAIDFAGSKIGGNVILRHHLNQRFTANSEVTFLGAQITGAFNASGALLNNPKGIALNFTRTDIRNSVFMTSDCNQRFEAKGELRFWIAQIGGQFALNGAYIDNKDGLALGLDGAVIRGNVFLVPADNGDRFTAIGEIRFVGTRIESNLISRDTDLDGVFDARNAHISALFDDAQTSWPRQPGQMKLSGLTYDRLHGNADDQRDNSLGRRVSWIKHQYKNPEHPICDEFDPQPFDQYAKILRARGQSADADQILVEMRALRLRSKTDPWAMRAFQKFLGLTCRYGYSGTRAITALLIWIVIGTGMYGAHALAGHFGPAEQVMHGNHTTTPNTRISIPGVIEKEVRGCPGLIAPLYAMDTILPIVEFGQRRACAFDPPGRLGAPLWRTLDFFFALIGAILFAITVVTLTGLLRED